MSPSMITVTLLAAAALAYQVGRSRAFSVAGDARALRRFHSRPAYHGLFTALWCGIPALIVLSGWLLFEDSIITGIVVSELPQQMQTLPPERLGLATDLLHHMQRLAFGAPAGHEAPREHEPQYGPGHSAPSSQSRRAGIRHRLWAILLEWLSASVCVTGLGNAIVNSPSPRHLFPRGRRCLDDAVAAKATLN